MIALGIGYTGVWFYVYSVRYEQPPDIRRFDSWSDIITLYSAPPPFDLISKEVVIGLVPPRLLEGGKKGSTDLKKRLGTTNPYRELLLLVEGGDSEETKERVSRFMLKHKAWLKPLERDPKELMDLYGLLRKVLTPDAYEWMMSRYRHIPRRISQELPALARAFNRDKTLITLDLVRRNMGDVVEVAERYVKFLGTPKGNMVLLDMKKGDLWSLFFSHNDYKSPVELVLSRACPILMASLSMLEFAVKEGYIGIREGALILNSWWVGVIKDRTTKPWLVQYTVSTLSGLRKDLGIV